MYSINNASYYTRSAVLFVIFNRPDLTKTVFDEIRSAKPPRLYIAADAPRSGHPADDLLCKEAKAVVDHIDWDCEIKTNFRTENAGCRDNVSEAVTWFFENEEEGIILEDDCLPAKSFFRFCDTMLNRYRNDGRVRHITGFNPQHGKKWGKYSYYFSNRTHVWGWASWKRTWKDFDKNLSNYDHGDVKEQLKNIFDDTFVVDSLAKVFEEVKTGKINSWAYPLDFINLFNNSLTVIPNYNLISNIGFGENATHTFDPENVYANIALSEIDEISHPVYFLPQKKADLQTIIRDFNIVQQKRKYNLPRKKIERWIKSIL